MEFDVLHRVVAGLILSLPNADPAYLDPGSGSFILQIIIASLAALSYAFRSQIAKLSNLFRRKDEDKDK